jgi:hypothetical protein
MFLPLAPSSSSNSNAAGCSQRFKYLFEKKIQSEQYEQCKQCNRFTWTEDNIIGTFFVSTLPRVQQHAAVVVPFLHPKSHCLCHCRRRWWFIRGLFFRRTSTFFLGGFGGTFEFGNPNVTDIIEQSQSKIYRNPSKRGKRLTNKQSRLSTAVTTTTGALTTLMVAIVPIASTR